MQHDAHLGILTEAVANNATHVCVELHSELCGGTGRNLKGQSIFDRAIGQFGLAPPPGLAAVQPAFGAWLIVLTGIATFGIAFGLMKNPVEGSAS